MTEENDKGNKIVMRADSEIIPKWKYLMLGR